MRKAVDVILVRNQHQKCHVFEPTSVEDILVYQNFSIDTHLGRARSGRFEGKKYVSKIEKRGPYMRSRRMSGFKQSIRERGYAHDGVVVYQ